MRFPYQQYAVTPTPLYPDGVLYRPEVPIVIEGPLGTITMAALLDTGADETIFPKYIADELGIPMLEEDEPSKAAGFTGHQLEISHGEVGMALVDADGLLSHRFNATVGFCDFPNPESETVLFGHAGCLDSMRVVFDGSLHEAIVEAHWLS